MRIFILIALLAIGPASYGSTSFPAKTKYQVCFTPGHNCKQLLISRLNKAKSYINVQAYSFTSYAIAHALVRAQKRGVKVRVIVDKSNFDHRHRTVVRYLLRHHMAIWCDCHPRIAHNKVMIIDGQTVETGSFNYTYSAQNFNAENMLIINDQHLASIYLANWFERQHKSMPTVSKNTNLRRCQSQSAGRGESNKK